MLKLSWTTASLLLALAGCAAAVPPVAESPQLRVLELASVEWPPFTAVEGEPRVASELVAMALRADAIQAEQTILPVEEWLAALRSGEVDGSAAVWWSEDRAEYLLFSEPYLENRLVLIGRTGADVSATSFSQLAGKRIGIIEGYTYGETVEDGVEGPEFVPSSSVPDNVRALLAGELDYVLADALFATYSIATHPQKLDLVVGEHALALRTLHFAVRKDRPDAQAIIDHFDGRVRQMLRDGSYNRILGIEWIEADTDGDGVSELIFQGTHAGVEPPDADYRVLTPEQQRKVEVEVQPDYIINGQRYDAWEFVPDSFKATGVGGTNVGIGIRW